jgi:hypothetical protein
MIMAPTPMKTEFPDAGSLFNGDQVPALHLSLQVTREQFSDLIRLFEAGRLKSFYFSVEEGTGGAWPVRSWGMSTEHSS